MTLTAVFTITLSLLILGCFYIVIGNFNHFADMAKGVLELRVYLTDDADPVDLQTKILAVPGVKSVRFVAKEDGARWLEKNLGVKGLFVSNDNPLPDMITLKLKDSAKVKELVDQIRNMAGVTEIEYGKSFVEAMLVVLKVIWIVGTGLTIIIALVVLYIIINTIRLTVFARRKEIEIMKLVGATDWFIRWPFLLEGIFLGLGAALISIVFLSKGYHFLETYIRQLAPFIPLLGERMINRGLFWLIPGAGLVFGAIGSMLSLKRFLRV